MNTGELLTVKEFAAAADVSTQRIYKLMKTTLKPFVANDENGLTLIHSDGLRVFGLNHSLQLCNKELQTEGCKAESPDNTGIDSNLPPDELIHSLQLCNNGLQHGIARDTDRLIDTQAAEIETLKAELDTLKAELTAKNTQISLLQAHTDRQQQTIDNLTNALTQQQALNAAAAVIQKQLIEQNWGAGDTQSETEAAESKGDAADQSEETPKQSFFARIFGKR